MKTLLLFFLLMGFKVQAQNVISNGFIHRGAVVIGRNDTLNHVHEVYYTLPPQYSFCPIKNCVWNLRYHRVGRFDNATALKDSLNKWADEYCPKWKYYPEIYTYCSRDTILNWMHGIKGGGSHTMFLYDESTKICGYSSTQQLIIDSLTKKLQLMMEYTSYAEEIIKCITVRNKMGDVRVYFKDQIGGRIAYIRFKERYKN